MSIEILPLGKVKKSPTAKVTKKKLPKIVKGKTSPLDKVEGKRRKEAEDSNLKFLNFMAKQNPKYFESVKKAKELSGQAEAERQGRGASIPDDAGRFAKKRGGMNTPKKSIMDLPTNVPRLRDGALLGDLNKDGKMSGYETARQNAIEKSMAEQKSKKAKSGLAIGISKIKS
tara:strand:- start:6399 stop:6914 length:516 start_codon:yes stop_codon:yes gene_type:complete